VGGLRRGHPDMKKENSPQGKESPRFYYLCKGGQRAKRRRWDRSKKGKLGGDGVNCYT